LYVNPSTEKQKPPAPNASFDSSGAKLENETEVVDPVEDEDPVEEDEEVQYDEDPTWTPEEVDSAYFKSGDDCEDNQGETSRYANL